MNIDFLLQLPGVESPEEHTQGQRGAYPFIWMTDCWDCSSVAIVGDCSSEPHGHPKEAGKESGCRVWRTGSAIG